jgi:membrane protease YdiL (CAAX protease family)
MTWSPDSTFRAAAPFEDDNLATNPPITTDIMEQPTPPVSTRPVAPVWHTVVFLVIVFAAAALSAERHGERIIRHGHLFTYLFTMGWEWLLVGFVLWGARKNGFTLKDLVGGKWKSPEDGLIDAAIAVGFWIAAALVLVLAAAAAGLVDPAKLEAAKKNVDVLKPIGSLESVMWVCLSITAGFCEEVMFRGYIQKQFAAWTRSDIAALLLQAIVFGVAHSYQGARLAFVVTVYGMMFGVLAHMRRSLRPGMMAHAMQDTLSGLVRNLPTN